MSNLNDPIKTPVVYLYNATGTLLASTIEKLALGIVEFSYEYNDEEEDKCLIKIQAKNANAIDALDIGRNDVLKLKWGYLKGPLSPMVTVAVRDISSKYGPNIIYTEYECNDLTNYLKLVRSEDIRTMSLIQYLDDYATKQVNVVIQSGTDVIYKQALKDPNKAKVRFLEFMSEANPIIFDPFYKYLRGEKLTLPQPSPTEVSAMGHWYVNPDNEIRKYFEKDIDMVSTNRSPYTVVAEYLNSCPYGPWYITGRGNTLFIHNRNLGNEIFKVYSYAAEPGDLMDFTAETKYDSFEKQRITSTGMDPYTKSAVSMESYLTRLSTQQPIKEILQNTKISKEERQKLIKEFVYFYHTGFKLNKIGVNIYNTFTNRNPWEDNYLDRGIPYNEDQYITAQKSLVDVIYVAEGERNDSPLKKYAGQVIIYSMPADSMEDIQTEEENTLRKLEMETEEATMIVEGDPYLMSEFVVGVNNVQKAHQGNYYIKKCEHSITEMGYKTTLETLKVKTKAIIRRLITEGGIEATEKENEVALKLRDYFIRQQEIFKKWDIKVKVPIFTASGNVTVPGTSIDLSLYKTLEDILEDKTKNQDQQIEIINRLFYSPGLDVSYTERDIYSPEVR